MVPLDRGVAAQQAPLPRGLCSRRRLLLCSVRLGRVKVSRGLSGQAASYWVGVVAVAVQGGMGGSKRNGTDFKPNRHMAHVIDTSSWPPASRDRQPLGPGQPTGLVRFGGSERRRSRVGPRRGLVRTGDDVRALTAYRNVPAECSRRIGSACLHTLKTIWRHAFGDAEKLPVLVEIHAIRASI